MEQDYNNYLIYLDPPASHAKIRYPSPQLSFYYPNFRTKKPRRNKCVLIGYPATSTTPEQKQLIYKCAHIRSFPLFKGDSDSTMRTISYTSQRSPEPGGGGFVP